MSDYGRPCYHVFEPGVGRVLIPGCMGAAVYGKRGCTCGSLQRANTVEQKLDEILGRLAALENAGRGAAA